MLTTGKSTHYCAHCGYDMRAKEERMCPSCDGDLCEPSKRAALRDLPKTHPRVVAAKKHWLHNGCRHRPECLTVGEHIRRASP